MLNGTLLPDWLVPAIVWLVRTAFVWLLVQICISDFRIRRIPNRLVLAGLIVALVWQTLGAAGSGLFDSAAPGALGVSAAASGAFAAFTGFLLLHWMRMMGAGDVKLMAMLGAFFGLEALPTLVLFVFLTGGVLAALRMFDGDRRRAVFTNLKIIVFGRLAAAAGAAGPQFDPRTDSADRLPFALAISGGACLLAALQWAGVVA